MKDSDADKVQGEGDYEAARRYRKKVRKFVDGADVSKAAKDAKPRSSNEAKQLTDAEAKGLSRSKSPGQ